MSRRTSLFAALGPLVAVLAFACSSDPAPATPNTAACDTYCAKIATVCSGANAQYIDAQTCASMCRLMDPGAARDVVGDSQACRANALSSAQEVEESKRRDPCFQSGPYSTRCAADECAAFCKLDLAICTGVDTAYATRAECQDACARIKAKQNGFATEPLTTTTTGNSLICRAYHLEAASTNRAVHCAHTKETGGPCN